LKLKQDEVVIGPASEFQQKYLNSDAQIILVGGAAGSSKSYVGLMRHLRFIHDPNYKAYCIRKNSSAIMASGGLFQEAVKLYSQFDPKVTVRMKDQKIVFPSGAEVSFSHYENDNAAKKYQGIQISNIFYDEVTHADNEEQLWWLWSRLRSDSKNVHSMWWSCNPQNDHWVLKYALWWLFPEGHPLAGRPDPEKNGVIRYLLRISGDLVWGDTKEELIERFGNPDLPHDHEDQVQPISFQGLFGTIEDNPPLCRSNPAYKKNLEALPRLDCERLRWGNWFARPANSTYFDRTTCEELMVAPHASEFTKIVRSYDFAGTLPHDGNRETDYFASVKMGKLKTGDYVILEVVRTRITFGSWFDHILGNAERDGRNVEIIIPEDPNAQAKAATKLLARSINESGYVCKTRRSALGKLESFRPFAACAEIGSVKVVKNCATDLWNKIYNDNEFYYKELEAFDGDTRRYGVHDDCVDCTSLSFMFLAQKFQIPSYLSGLQSSDSIFKTTNPFA
jgi:phage terminase large subunit-like protein